MKKRIFDDNVIEVDGFKFRVVVDLDEHCGQPWENMSTLGDVSKWESRDKHPGERILATDRSHKLFYSFADAVAKARAEGMSGEESDKAANAEFEYLRRWCADLWHYVFVCVTRVEENEEGELIDTNESDSIGGVESDADEYIAELATENARSLAIQAKENARLDSAVAFARIQS